MSSISGSVSSRLHSLGSELYNNYNNYNNNDDLYDDDDHYGNSGIDSDPDNCGDYRDESFHDADSRD